MGEINLYALFEEIRKHKELEKLKHKTLEELIAKQIPLEKAVKEGVKWRNKGD